MKYILSFSIIFLLNACSSNDVKEKINKAGNVAGQAVGEFSSGVANGVEKAFEAKIELTQSIKESGITFGKTTVSSDSVGSDNLLTVYVIFNNDFSDKLIAKAFDSKGEEMGRCIVELDGKIGEAKYVDFHFDKRTNIDNDSKLTIEKF